MAKELNDHKEVSGAWGWAIIALLCVAILGWGYANYFYIKDAPRQWDFATLPDVPSQSVYSTDTPPQPAGAPRQIAPLPEAQSRSSQETAP